MFGLVMALMLVVTSQGAFAQISISLTANPPSPGEIQTNRNAMTAQPEVSGGGILVTASLIAASPLTQTQLRIAFPGPITSAPAICRFTDVAGDEIACPDPNIPIDDEIRIEGATGVFGGGSVTQPILNTVNSRIEIWLPGTGAFSNTASGSFRIIGVRIDANGKTGAQAATASLSDAAANYLLTTSSVTVISDIANGIGNLAIGARPGSEPSLGTASIFTNRTSPDQRASFVLTEGFASAFRSRTELSNSGSALADATANSTSIRLTFNNVPTGVTLNLSLPYEGADPEASLSNTSITSAANTSILEILDTSLTSTETLEVRINSINLTSSAAVTTEGAITVTATFFPIDDGLDDNGAPSDAAGYPTFAQLDVGPITVVNIVSANTTMLIPLAEKIGAFDTGISVANTTADPFGGASGGGAAASAGTLKFDFFPSSATGAGTACTLTTSSTNRPGFGISSDGTIAAGATYTVLLSQLLPVSNCAAGDFVGYIFVTANFLNAHGQATISDFRTYSLAANVLVLPPPATSPRTLSSDADGVESLGF
jgi:hypothetical protein